jgi:hypothetical protein
MRYISAKPEYTSEYQPDIPKALCIRPVAITADPKLPKDLRGFSLTSSIILSSTKSVSTQIRLRRN